MPVTWQGWALIGAYTALVTAESLVLMTPPPPRVGLFVALVAVETVALNLIARARTDGEWRWRWGGG